MGAAKFARLYRGAKYGQGVGRQGNSYAIPTKDYQLRVLPLDEIEIYVARFINYAFSNRHLEFEVTKIGCSLAGYKEREIAPMFEWAPPNCYLPRGW